MGGVETAPNTDFDGEDATSKRKRDVADLGERAQKKLHVEDRRLGIEDLHLDVGEKYLLCRTRKTPFFLNGLTYCITSVWQLSCAAISRTSFT